MSPNHELVILTKLHNNRARIVDFLLILQFGPSLIFSGQSLIQKLLMGGQFRMSDLIIFFDIT